MAIIIKSIFETFRKCMWKKTDAITIYGEGDFQFSVLKKTIKKNHKIRMVQGPKLKEMNSENKKCIPYGY